MSKFSDIFNIASTVGKQFLPPVGGAILDEVNQTLNKPGSGPQSAAAVDALQALAADNDEQTKAILAMSHVIADLTERLKKLESK
jgi:hypothetical protein